MENEPICNIDFIGQFALRLGRPLSEFVNIALGEVKVDEFITNTPVITTPEFKRLKPISFI